MAHAQCRSLLTALVNGNEFLLLSSISRGTAELGCSLRRFRGLDRPLWPHLFSYVFVCHIIPCLLKTTLTPAETYIYYSRYPKDSKWIKYLVRPCPIPYPFVQLDFLRSRHYGSYDLDYVILYLLNCSSTLDTASSALSAPFISSSKPFISS